jgi:UDP-2,3-diacylglucosamine pyrophosphatase LpxH
VETHVFDSGGRRLLCVHGDQFDSFITERPVATFIGDWTYWAAQSVSARWARMLKRTSKEFIRCREKVRDGAVVARMAAKADAVCCGHTHNAEHNDALGYYNSGCWTEERCHYLAVESGQVRLERFE